VIAEPTWAELVQAPLYRPDVVTPGFALVSEPVRSEALSVGAPTFSQAEVATGGITSRLRKASSFGFAGAVLSLCSIVWDPFIVTSLLGIVLCIVGLIRDADRRQDGEEMWGGRWVIAGLLLGCASAIVYGVLLLAKVALLIS
jgi:hypothetical protein